MPTAMSADTSPISPSRFASALKDLSLGMLHLKVLEIRNSIAHLQYSNDQLKPFAEGSAVPLGDPSAPSSGSAVAAEPDQDCIDAIRENEQVIDRMAERLALISAEVEDRGVSWSEFQRKDEEPDRHHDDDDDTSGGGSQVNGETAQQQNQNQSQTRHSAWTDGTFQTGTIRAGQVHLDSSQPGRPGAGAAGGSLSDEQLRAALEERMRDLGTDDAEAGDEDEDGGLHL